MNIYDEALNSNKKIRMRYESIVGDFYKEDYDNIDNALEHAKKEYEMFGLYKQKDKLRDEFFNEFNSVYVQNQLLENIIDELNQTKNNIEKLEKELEALK